jgi:hypothetical protein
MVTLWQFHTPTHFFHGFRPKEGVSLCGIPRGGSWPSAETIEIPLEIRCVLCEAVRKQERKRLGLEVDEPQSYDDETDETLLNEVAEKYHE